MTEPLLGPVDVAEPDVTIVVPTAGRAGRVLVDKMLPADSFVVLCPHGELDAYQAAQPHLTYEPYPLPEGNIARKWAWSHERWGSVFWLDDDLDRFVHLEHAGGEGRCNLDPDTAAAIIHRCAWEAAQAGCYLFGFGNGAADVRNFDDLHPLKVKGTVYSTMGLLQGSGMIFDDRVIGALDYWISLYNAYRHRKMWVDQRYEPAGPPVTFSNPGGMAALRTMGSEEADYRVLKASFGAAVHLKGDTHRAKIRHNWQRSITLPF